MQMLTVTVTLIAPGADDGADDGAAVAAVAVAVVRETWT